MEKLTTWYSVETPSVFKEIELPTGPETWTKWEWWRYERLAALAERHATSIRASAVRRG